MMNLKINLNVGTDFHNFALIIGDFIIRLM